MSKPNTPPSAPVSATAAVSSINTADLDTLAKWLEQSSLEEVEIESGGVRIRLRKTAQGGGVVMAPVAPSTASTVTPPATAHAVAETGTPFSSPMVGTYYQAANPDAAPFVKEGDNIREGQTLCIIEAMKTMNQIVADRAGIIRKVLLKNGQPVEFGQSLFIIE
jgi:acetyl-CoA carboxylase biotin carboxyl carrier protein